MAPRCCRNQLKGRSVVVITVPNSSDDDVTAVKESLSAAGATFAGQLGLTETLRDREGEKLRSIIDQSIPPGRNLRPGLTDSGGRLGDLLGLLLQIGPGRGSIPATEVDTSLQSLREGGFISYTDRAPDAGAARRDRDRRCVPQWIRGAGASSAGSRVRSRRADSAAFSPAAWDRRRQGRPLPSCVPTRRWAIRWPPWTA